MGRTVHSSYVELDPTEYEYVESFDAGPHEPGSFMGEPNDYEVHSETVRANNPFHAEYLYCVRKLRQSATSLWDGSGQCDHCGARLRYTILMFHNPTASYMAIGETCFDERFSHDSKVAAKLDRLHKRAEASRVRSKFLKALEAWLDADPRNREAVEYAEANREGNSFYDDLLRKLKEYGPWTDRQRDAVLRGIAKDAERAALPPEVKVPCPTGKVTVTGVVVKLDTADGYMPGDVRYVMTVKDDTGFLVWGTRPSALSRVEKGDRVTFSATVEQSDRDECFGFYKRPTKASVIPQGPIGPWAGNGSSPDGT